MEEEMEGEVVKGQTRRGPVNHTKESGCYLTVNKGVPLEGIKLKAKRARFSFRKIGLTVGMKDGLTSGVMKAKRLVRRPNSLVRHCSQSSL